MSYERIGFKTFLYAQGLTIPTKALDRSLTNFLIEHAFSPCSCKQLAKLKGKYWPAKCTYKPQTNYINRSRYRKHENSVRYSIEV